MNPGRIFSVRVMRLRWRLKRVYLDKYGCNCADPKAAGGMKLGGLRVVLLCYLVPNAAVRLSEPGGFWIRSAIFATRNPCTAARPCRISISGPMRATSQWRPEDRAWDSGKQGWAATHRRMRVNRFVDHRARSVPLQSPVRRPRRRRFAFSAENQVGVRSDSGGRTRRNPSHR